MSTVCLSWQNLVAPLKVTTIPRLELTAAVTSIKASSVLKAELQYEIMDEFFWTDSKVVLMSIMMCAISMCLSQIECKEYISAQSHINGNTFPQNSQSKIFK